MNKKLNVSASPHVRSKDSTSSIMRDVVIAMVPTTIVGIANAFMNFGSGVGINSILVILITMAAAIGAEYVYEMITKKPITICDWSAAVTGLIAKENVVATFGMLFGFAEVAEDGSEVWGSLAAVMTPVAAYGFLAFNLLCAPCFAAMGAIKREMNNTKWFWFAIGYQCLLAYVVAMVIYQLGTFFTGGGFGIGTVVAVVLVIGFLYLLFRPYKEATELKVNVKKTKSA